MDSAVGQQPPPQQQREMVQPLDDQQQLERPEEHLKALTQQQEGVQLVQPPLTHVPPMQQYQQQDPAVTAGVHSTKGSAASAPSDFMMYVFKVVPCPHGNSHAWAHCPFLHPGEHARRRDPRVYPYIPIACPNMKRFNSCARGDGCPNSHSDFEYWLHPHRYRTQLCRDGAACRRKVCFFAHDPRELRPPTAVLAADDALPLSPRAMPRVIGLPAGADPAATVAPIQAAAGSSGSLPAAQQQQPGGDAPASGLQAGLATAPVQAVELASLLTAAPADADAGAPTGSSGTPHTPAAVDGGHGAGAAAAAGGASSVSSSGAALAPPDKLGQQLAGLQLAAGEAAEGAAKPAGVPGEGGSTTVDGSSGPEQAQPAGLDVVLQASGVGIAQAATAAGDTLDTPAAGAAAPMDAAAAAAAHPDRQQLRVAAEVLDASGKPVYVHPDNVKVLEVLLQEAGPTAPLHTVRQQQQREPPLLRYKADSLPEVMAAVNRAPPPAVQRPGLVRPGSAASSAGAGRFSPSFPRQQQQQQQVGGRRGPGMWQLRAPYGPAGGLGGAGALVGRGAPGLGMLPGLQEPGTGTQLAGPGLAPAGMPRGMQQQMGYAAGYGGAADGPSMGQAGAGGWVVQQVPGAAARAAGGMAGPGYAGGQLLSPGDPQHMPGMGVQGMQGNAAGLYGHAQVLHGYQNQQQQQQHLGAGGSPYVMVQEAPAGTVAAPLAWGHQQLGAVGQYGAPLQLLPQAAAPAAQQQYFVMQAQEPAAAVDQLGSMPMSMFMTPAGHPTVAGGMAVGMVPAGQAPGEFQMMQLQQHQQRVDHLHGTAQGQLLYQQQQQQHHQQQLMAGVPYMLLPGSQAPPAVPL